MPQIAVNALSRSTKQTIQYSPYSTTFTKPTLPATYQNKDTSTFSSEIAGSTDSKTENSSFTPHSHLDNSLTNETNGSESPEAMAMGKANITEERGEISIATKLSTTVRPSIAVLPPDTFKNSSPTSKSSTGRKSTNTNEQVQTVVPPKVVSTFTDRTSYRGEKSTVSSLRLKNENAHAQKNKDSGMLTTVLIIAVVIVFFIVALTSSFLIMIRAKRKRLKEKEAALPVIKKSDKTNPVKELSLQEQMLYKRKREALRASDTTSAQIRSRSISKSLSLIENLAKIEKMNSLRAMDVIATPTRKLLALSVGKNSVQMAARSVQRRQLGMSVGRNSTQIGARSVQRNTSAIGVNRKSAQMVPKAPEAPIQTNATETHPRYDLKNLITSDATKPNGRGSMEKVMDSMNTRSI